MEFSLAASVPREIFVKEIHSPYLFIFVVEAFIALISRVENVEINSRIQVTNQTMMDSIKKTKPKLTETTWNQAITLHQNQNKNANA